MEELIKEYHRLYAEFKRPEYLEIAALLGKVPKLDEFVFERMVNAGCERQGKTPVYPELVNR